LYADWGYRLGDTGPGGGKIFYRLEVGFTFYANATDTTGTTAYYLEAAPTDMGSMLAWASGGYTTTDIPGTGSAIGTGRKTTDIILATDAAAPAANDCYNYANNGKTDWFLPSKDEMNELYGNMSYVGNMGTNVHWSSSQNNSSTAWARSFTSDAFYANNKASTYSVRAIRAF
jgi:hypothetical protein